MAVPAAGFGGFVGVAGFVDGIFLLASFSGAGGAARFLLVTCATLVNYITTRHLAAGKSS